MPSETRTDVATVDLDDTDEEAFRYLRTPEHSAITRHED